MTERWWDEPPRPSTSARRTGPTPDFGRRAPRRPSYDAWGTSVVAYGILMVTSTVIFGVVAFAGLLLAPIVGLSGLSVSVGEITGALVLVWLSTQAVALSFQVRYIVRQGGDRAVSACLTALLATAVLGLVADLVRMPTVGAMAAAAVVQITVVALMTRPAR